MANVFQFLAKYIGVPLAKYTVGILISWGKKAWEDYQTSKKIKEDAKKIEEAKSDEETRDAHRNNTRNFKL
jgi:hypothetical protein